MVKEMSGKAGKNPSSLRDSHGYKGLLVGDDKVPTATEVEGAEGKNKSRGMLTIRRL